MTEERIERRLAAILAAHVSCKTGRKPTLSLGRPISGAKPTFSAQHRNDAKSNETDL